MDNLSPNMESPGLGPAKSLEGFLELYLVKKAPFQLPAGLKEFIVKAAPWLSLLGLIIGLPIILTAFGISALSFNILGNYGGFYGAGFSFYPYLILTGVIVVLEAIAIPGLFKRSLSAWRFIFYASLLQIVSGLVSGHILNALITGLISLYFLFQVKEYYK